MLLLVQVKKSSCQWCLFAYGAVKQPKTRLCQVYILGFGDIAFGAVYNQKQDVVNGTFLALVLLPFVCLFVLLLYVPNQQLWS